MGTSLLSHRAPRSSRVRGSPASGPRRRGSPTRASGNGWTNPPGAQELGVWTPGDSSARTTPPQIPRALPRQPRAVHAPPPQRAPHPRGCGWWSHTAVIPGVGDKSRVAQCLGIPEQPFNWIAFLRGEKNLSRRPLFIGTSSFFQDQKLQIKAKIKLSPF